MKNKASFIDIRMGQHELRSEAFQILMKNLPQYARTLDRLSRNTGENAIQLATLQDNRMSGVVLGGHLNSHATYLNFFFVIPEFRQAGIGKILHDEFESRVKQANRTRIECDVYDERVAKWFQKQRYVESCSRINYEVLLKQYGKLAMLKQLG